MASNNETQPVSSNQETELQAVYSAKSKLDQVVALVLSSTQSNHGHCGYEKEVEQHLVNTTKMVRELLDQLYHRPNELIMESIDLTGIDDDEPEIDEQIAPSELPVLQVGEDDFDAFTPVSRRYFRPCLCCLSSTTVSVSLDTRVRVARELPRYC